MPDHQYGVEKKNATSSKNTTTRTEQSFDNNNNHNNNNDDGDRNKPQQGRCHRRASSTRSATLGMLADVASREVQEAKQQQQEAKQNNFLPGSKKNKVQKPSLRKSPPSDNSGGDTTVTTTNNNNNKMRKLISERRGELGLKRPAGSDMTGVLKRQRSAPEEYTRFHRPALLRQRSTGSHISFSDKVQIADSLHFSGDDTSSAASSVLTKCATNNNQKPPPFVMRRGDRQQSLESLKLPSFIKMNDRQFSLESMMSFRSQESTPQESVPMTPSTTTAFLGRETPTSVDTPNTARMEKFYQECCMNSSGNIGSNTSTMEESPANTSGSSQPKIADISNSTISSGSIAAEPPRLSFRPPKRQDAKRKTKFIATTVCNNRKEEEDETTKTTKGEKSQNLRRAVSNKEDNSRQRSHLQERSSSAPAINKPQALEGHVLRGWLDGSIASSTSSTATNTTKNHFPQPALYGGGSGGGGSGIPPNHFHRRPTSLATYNTSNTTNTSNTMPSMDSRRPLPYNNHSSSSNNNNNRPSSSTSFIDRQSSFENSNNMNNSNNNNSHLHHYQGGLSNNTNRNFVRKVTESQQQRMETTAATNITNNTAYHTATPIKFGHPRNEVVEGQQIYSRHTLLLWGAHKSDVCPVGGTPQEGCNSLLIGANDDTKIKNSVVNSKDDLRFAQIKCSLRNGGSALFTNYQKKTPKDPIRLFRKTRGAGGLVGYRYDGLYHIMAILDDATGKPRSAPLSESSFRILLERNPAGQRSNDQNHLSLEELWDFVQQASSLKSDTNTNTTNTIRSAPTHKNHPHAAMHQQQQQQQQQQRHHHQYHPQDRISSGNFMTHNTNTNTMHNTSSMPPFSYHEKGPPIMRGGTGHYAINNKQGYPNNNIIPPVSMQRKKSAEVSLLHIQYFDDDTNNNASTGRPTATTSNQHPSYHHHHHHY